MAFADGLNGLEIHVENCRDKGSITKLKNVASNTYQILLDQAKVKKVKFDKVSISIWAEDNLVQTAERVRFWDYLKRQILDKILSTFLMSLFGGLVGYVAAGEPLSGFLATLAALLLRILLEAFNFKGEFIYGDT